MILFPKTILLPLLAALALCAQEGIKKVTAAEANAAAAAKTQPEYPPVAKQLRIEGKVELEAVVSENGSVEKVNIVTGNPVLTKPAVEALRHWKFTPFVEDGKPCKALAPVGFTFKL